MESSSEGCSARRKVWEVARVPESGTGETGAVDEEIQQILEETYQRAVNTLQRHRDALDRLAEALLEHEELPGDEVLEIIGVDE